MATTPAHVTAPYGAGRQSTLRTTSGSPAGVPDESRPIRPRKDYGRGLPPPGPSNYLVSTPNFLPFERDDDSEQGK